MSVPTDRGPTGGPDRRWPRSVYGVGSEPDPRFTFANERTFLAWIRTSLALLACGIALEAVALPMQPQLRLAASVVLGQQATLDRLARRSRTPGTPVASPP